MLSATAKNSGSQMVNFVCVIFVLPRVLSIMQRSPCSRALGQCNPRKKHAAILRCLAPSATLRAPQEEKNPAAYHHKELAVRTPAGAHAICEGAQSPEHRPASPTRQITQLYACTVQLASHADHTHTPHTASRGLHAVQTRSRYPRETTRSGERPRVAAFYSSQSTGPCSRGEESTPLPGST